MTKRIISIDPGNALSGLLILDNHAIALAENVNNVVLFDLILLNLLPSTDVVIEDVKPYSVPLRQQTIDTCKFLGELEYRLKSNRIAYSAISRSEVKTWVFNRFPEICIPAIDKKIERKGLFACDVLTRRLVRVYADGRPWSPRKASHNYVDDRVIISCMKKCWEIETPKPGKRNRLGVSKHSWQALALATLYLERDAIRTEADKAAVDEGRGDTSSCR